MESELISALLRMKAEPTPTCLQSTVQTVPYANSRLQKLFNASDIQMISEYIKWKANKA